jgi:hypothetical protein
LARDARHYPDLFVLAGQHEVRAMLASPEYGEIRADYDANSRRYFADGYRPPAALCFADSPALFPDPALRSALAAEYKQQCELLFPAVYPSFDEVLARFEEVRSLL